MLLLTSGPQTCGFAAKSKKEWRVELVLFLANILHVPGLVLLEGGTSAANPLKSTFALLGIYGTFVMSYHFFLPQNPLRDFDKFGFGFGGGGGVVGGG